MSKPFVKWAGGKYRLSERLIPLMPKEFDPSKNTYIEPMVGSGGFFFNYNPKRAYLSDINKNLITTYNVIKNDVENLIDNLKKYKKLHNQAYFEKQRKLFNKLIKKGENELEIASLFIYLNKTCFNGLYRENSKGEFNVPIGAYKNPLICDEENLLSVNKTLQSIEIGCHSYEKSINKIKKGDFVYIDPPYIPIDLTSFTKYSKDDFGENEHIELSNFCDRIDSKGAFYMLSNSDTKKTRDIYFTVKEEQGQFLIFEDINEQRFSDQFLVSRSISSNAKKRNKAKELIITNYKIQKNVV
tara:strand:+ start:3598 stop:4494 length:897 start_codon:yes stop_codon:yes gene_type:complete